MAEKPSVPHPSAAGVLRSLACSRVSWLALVLLVLSVALLRDECAEDATSVVAQVVDLPPGVVRFAGSPEEMGRQHGSALKSEIQTVIREYISDDLTGDKLPDGLAARVKTMRASLPDWYLAELKACAAASEVDEDVLLYLQCEGDIKSLGGCTTYVAFGATTHDGSMEIGRNFDYWGLQSTEACAKVFLYQPRPEEGHAFVSVGWTGILGGWTFYNEKGLFVANNLGGFAQRNPAGIPTLILERIIAQKAATVEEGIAIIRKGPRMRGQALILGQDADPSSGSIARAVVVLYDGVDVEVTEAKAGWVFNSSVGTEEEALREQMQKADRKPIEAIMSAGVGITLHSVAIRPREQALWVAHGRPSEAHLAPYVRLDLKALLARQPAYGTVKP